MEITHGYLLGGRLHYAQPAHGYRTGIEPVLLAASVPARPGQRVLEAGTGAGAGLLCLAARVPGLTGLGVEIDPATADLARRNLAANGFDAFDILTADVTSGLAGGFDHALANPPWHDPRSTPSKLAGRRRAKQAGGPGSAAGIAAWITALRGALLPLGTLTLILAAPLAEAAAASMRQNGLTPRVTRLLPKAGRSAKLVLLTGDPAPARTGPDLVLHEADGRYTQEAEAVLRGGGALATGSSS